MELSEQYLKGRKNEFFYLFKVEKEMTFKKLMFKASYTNGFSEWVCQYYIGEKIPTIIEI